MNELGLKPVYWIYTFVCLFNFLDLSLGSFRQQNGSKEKNHHGNYNNLHDITTTNPFHFYTNPKWYESYFDPIIPRNVTALVGKSAYLSCRVKNLGNKTISWIRHRDLHILTVGTYTYTTDQRFTTTHHKETDEWTLQIKFAQKRDVGFYDCQISTQPVKSYSVRLNLVTPTASILGGPDFYVQKGSTINLTCTIRLAPDESPAFIFWYHEDEVINYDSRGGISIETRKGDLTTSHLLIQNADETNSGKYSCSPSNAIVASIRVHVLNGEHPEAMHSRCTSVVQQQNLYVKNSLLIVLLLMLISHTAKRINL
ncbi:hypothetical protein ACKWTF_011189 [Chironomus riparius]